MKRSFRVRVSVSHGEMYTSARVTGKERESGEFSRIWEALFKGRCYAVARIAEGRAWGDAPIVSTTEAEEVSQTRRKPPATVYRVTVDDKDVEACVAGKCRGAYCPCLYHTTLRYPTTSYEYESRARGLTTCLAYA